MAANKKVLIVDDEIDFIEAFRRALEAKAYEVIATTSRADAQEKMRYDPDIVVLGTLTPAGEAFALHQWLRRHPRYKDLPLLVIDVPPEEKWIKGWRTFEGVQLTADDYVSKPIEPALLVPRIQALVEELIRLIKVLVTDDHTMVRDGICAVLSLQKDMQVVGEATNGKDAIDKVLRLTPDVALMDIVMPIMSGIAATKEIGKQHPETKVLVLTQYDEAENMLVAKQAGAQGFVPKKAASSQLLEAIRSVYKGEHYPTSFSKI